jgi:CDP-glycerol glycerophosphotransferase (TagB/SpsB family)
MTNRLNKKLRFYTNYFANHLFKKTNRVLICEPSHLETNNIEVANYIAEHYDMPVAYGLPKDLITSARRILSTNVELVDVNSRRFKFLYYTSKYIFTAHWIFPRFYTSKQTVLNIWHGIPLKRIGLMVKDAGMFANFTLATSELTKKIFANSFGVPPESVIVAGYPRNDVLLRAKKERVAIKSRLEGRLASFDKIILWLPTFRTHIAGNLVDGIPVENPFQIEGFDTDAFDAFLGEHNALCIVKSHPYDYQRSIGKSYANLRVISDEWMLRQGITLYHLAACSDIMVSDVSSIILDYLLIDQPVICFSTDFDEYKKQRGFVFDDIENWLPGKMMRSQDEFTTYLDGILKTGVDPCEARRKELKSAYFKYHDANSTKRLLEHVFIGGREVKHETADR